MTYEASSDWERMWSASQSSCAHAHRELLAERCAARGLLSTGSADFHGPDNRQFSRFLAFDTYGLTPELGPIGSRG